MPFVLTVSLLVLFVVALVGAAGYLIDRSVEPRHRHERRDVNLDGA